MPASLAFSRFRAGFDANLDRIAIAISGLCLAHCLATTILIAVVSSAGGLLSPLFHEVGLTLAIGFGVIALGRGFLTHGYYMPLAVGAFGLGVMAGAMQLEHGLVETTWTLIGVSIVALGHDLNRRATY